MKTVRNILPIILISISLLGHSQIKDVAKPGFYWAVNAGVYFGNENDASFYNGDNTRPAKLEDVLGQQTIRQDILDYYNEDNFFLLNLGSRFLYKPAAIVGLHLQYNTSNKLGFYSDINVLLLQSHGIFMIEFTSPPIPPKTTNRQEGLIYASERRFNISGGFHLLLPAQNKYTPYIDLGFTASILQTDKHRMEIGNMNYSLLYTSADYSMEQSILYSAFGYGPQIGAGVQFPVSSKYVVFTGAYTEFLSYNLIESGFNMNNCIIIRAFF